MTRLTPEQKAAQRAGDTALSAFATFAVTVLIALGVHLAGHPLPWWAYLMHVTGFVITAISGMAWMLLRELDKGMRFA